VANPPYHSRILQLLQSGRKLGRSAQARRYDAVVVQGKSESPVYVLIEDERVQIKDASSLWGKSTVEARETLQEQLGSQVSVVAIGQAGENMVAFASVLADKDASGSSAWELSWVPRN